MFYFVQKLYFKDKWDKILVTYLLEDGLCEKDFLMRVKAKVNTVTT